jgi:hypothetical protein
MTDPDKTTRDTNSALGSETPNTNTKTPDFERRGLLRDFWDYLMENKKWWILPIVIGILALMLIIMASTPALAPFIYTLF